MTGRVVKVNLARIYFIGAFLLGFIGVNLWSINQWKPVAQVSDFHTSLMIGGFFTWILSGTLVLHRNRVLMFGLALLGMSLAWLVLFLGQSILYWPLMALSYLLLMTASLRWDKNPPLAAHGSMLFLGAGFLCATLGSLVFFALDLRLANGARLFLFAQELLYRAYPLSALLGLANILVPKLRGLDEIVRLQNFNSKRQFRIRAAIRSDLLWCCFLLVLSFPLSIWFDDFFAGTLRGVVLFHVGFRYWGLTIRSVSSQWYARFLLIAGWTIVMGELLVVIFPTQAIHFKHISFAFGFSFMLYAFALAEISPESMARGKMLFLWPGVFMFLAMLTRAFAHWAPNSYANHLSYAAWMWTISWLMWITTCFTAQSRPTLH